MEFACQGAAATAHVDDGYRLPDTSLPHAQMTVDALCRELLKESIRQEIIVAELAERRELGPEAWRGLRSEYAAPLCTRAGLQLTKLRRNDKSPLRQEGQLQLHMPMSLELCLEESMVTRGEASMPKRRSAKERMEEWYRPPWHNRSADGVDALIGWARLPIKTFSGVKRRRTAETSAPNNEKSFEQWICALCHVKTCSERSFEDHCAGRRHRSNVAYMELTKEATGMNGIATTVSYPNMQHNPTAWDCSICQVKCSGESDLKCHLNGRRHQENVEALWRESKRTEEIDLQEAKLYEKKAPQLVDNNKRPALRWNCSICKATAGIVAKNYVAMWHLCGTEVTMKANFS